MLARVTSLFPLWALLLSLLAYAWPEAFVGAKPMIVPLLGVVMLGMGAGHAIDVLVGPILVAFPSSYLALQRGFGRST